MTVAVVVPWRPTPDPHRCDALSHVASMLVRRNEWRFVIGLDDNDEWCKALAVEHGLALIGDADILVIHDADVLVDRAALDLAIDAVRYGAPWAVPHRDVYRFDEATTSTLLAGDPMSGPPGLARPPYVGVAGGGITVLPTETYLDCPLDRRFTSWGSEDECFGWALNTLHGAPWRGDAPLTHLWHMHAAPGARRNHAPDAELLRRAYMRYRSDPPKMRALVNAGR